MFVSASNFLTDVRRDLNDPKLFMYDKFREDISKHVTRSAHLTRTRFCL